MASSPLKISSIVLGTCGAVTGLGIGVQEILKPAPRLITELLKEKSLGLIPKEADESKVWNPKWKEFKSNYELIKERWEIAEWDKKVGKEDATPKEFKDKCNEIATKQKVRYGDEEIFKEVVYYCTKNKDD